MLYAWALLGSSMELASEAIVVHWRSSLILMLPLMVKLLVFHRTFDASVSI